MLIDSHRSARTRLPSSAWPLAARGAQAAHGRQRLPAATRGRHSRRRVRRAQAGQQAGGPGRAPGGLPHGDRDTGLLPHELRAAPCVVPAARAPAAATCHHKRVVLKATRHRPHAGPVQRAQPTPGKVAPSGLHTRRRAFERVACAHGTVGLPARAKQLLRSPPVLARRSAARCNTKPSGSRCRGFAPASFARCYRRYHARPTDPRLAAGQGRESTAREIKSTQGIAVAAGVALRECTVNAQMSLRAADTSRLRAVCVEPTVEGS